MGQCYSDRRSRHHRPQGQRRSRRNSLSLKPNQIYHLNHIECLPYQGRRSRYSTQSSSFLALVTRQTSAARSIPSTRQSSMAGSHPVLPQDHPYPASPGVPGLVLRRDSLLASSNPVLPRPHRRNSGGALLDEFPPRNHHHHHRQSLSELHPLSYEDYRRGGGSKVFRSYLDYQAVRQSYLLAVSQDSLLEAGPPPPSRPQSRQQQERPGQSEGQSAHSLSMDVFLSLPLHLVDFLFLPAKPHTQKCIYVSVISLLNLVI